MADEAIVRIENAIHPDTARVKQTTKQDRADSEHLRLTSEQASQLMDKPGLDSLQGLRDTAIIALALCTGIREAELCDLEVNDLRQRLGGELALHVRRGKGDKDRLIPYGSLSWVLVLVDCWLESAGISGGPVFRGFYKDGKTLRPGGLSVRAAQYILESYPVVLDGKVTQVRFHDLRRTYARRLYEAGLDLVAIQQNLGHVNSQTTLSYIGELGADKRRPPMVYRFDLGRLEKRRD
jgi:integrase/recombinase XerD